ncbi:ArdC family protein [Senegalia massiliensis]|uniref:ArdC family protein n=1 Tax=Senegalia massiliensis TaxID=1720316 RepID=UPI001FAD0D3B|nr:zincin-like metallopeptidase domain-containing protein [Senegalia massiliensis]
MAKKNVYDYVTERIIKQLEEGTIPWQKPWKGGLPINYISRKPYRGINLTLLPYSGEYLTFKQAKKLGATLKEGESKNWHMVTFFKFNDYKKEVVNKKGEKEIKIKTYPILRYYKVYHIDSFDGLESKLDVSEHDPIESAEEILNRYSEVPIYHKDNRAYYQPKNDVINVPKKELFETIEEYYSTAFHEMVHSTGHEERLDRFTNTDQFQFGSESYSFEELVAELGSSMLCGIAGIEDVTIDNSASYIKGWLSKLKNDKHLIVKASSQAQKACDYIQNLSSQQNIKEVNENVA